MKSSLFKSSFDRPEASYSKANFVSSKVNIKWVNKNTL